LIDNSSNFLILQKLVGVNLKILPIEAMETGENITYVVIEGETDANEIAKNLLDNFIIEQKSIQISADNNNIESYETEEQVVIRWCLPSELVKFLFNDITSIQNIQTVCNITLQVLLDRPSTSLTSQETVLVMIGTLTDITKAELRILTQIHEIKQGEKVI